MFCLGGLSGRVMSGRLGLDDEVGCDLPRNRVRHRGDEGRVIRRRATESYAKAATGPEQVEKPLAHELENSLFLVITEALHVPIVEDSRRVLLPTRRD